MSLRAVAALAVTLIVVGCSPSPVPSLVAVATRVVVSSSTVESPTRTSDPSTIGGISHGERVPRVE